MSVEEEYVDILQNIETGIARAFNRNPKVVDRDAVAAVEALIKAYKSEKASRGGKILRPSGRAGEVYEQCRPICEWRLGRQSLDGGEPGPGDPRPGDLSVSEMILCLKRIRKSIRLWHAQRGPQGYLKYVRQFLADVADALEE